MWYSVSKILSNDMGVLQYTVMYRVVPIQYRAIIINAFDVTDAPAHSLHDFVVEGGRYLSEPVFLVDENLNTYMYIVFHKYQPYHVKQDVTCWSYREYLDVDLYVTK